MCGYRGCLIADNDGIYDPGSANGRLLLGLKGQLSELELHTIRARMTAGLLNKAARGELALTLPVGLVRDALDRVHKDPNQEVQNRLDLIFATFLRLRSARMDNLMKLVTTALEWSYTQAEKDVSPKHLEAAAELLTLRRDVIRVIDAQGRKEEAPDRKQEAAE